MEWWRIVLLIGGWILGCISTWAVIIRDDGKDAVFDSDNFGIAVWGVIFLWPVVAILDLGTCLGEFCSKKEDK